MANVLLVYGTSEGHSAKVASFIADVGRRAGHQVHMVHGASIGAGLDASIYDAVIVGGSVHEGHHQNYVRDWIREHRDILERVPSALFQVSLASATTEAAAEQEVKGYVEQLSRETGWRPARVGLFAGALMYTQYSWMKRFVMRSIAKSAGRDTDTSRDHEYTDWDQVRRWSEEMFAQLPAATRAIAPPHAQP